jgi:hypothetical protein
MASELASLAGADSECAQRPGRFRNRRLSLTGANWTIPFKAMSTVVRSHSSRSPSFAVTTS